MTATATNTLPDKPSELIRVALEDLRKIEQTPGYTVSMAEWHNGALDSECFICMAGAVMACRLGVKREENRTAGQFRDGISAKLHAINEFRAGAWKLGFETLELEMPDDALPHPPRYDEDRDGFYAALEQAASILEQNGL